MVGLPLSVLDGDTDPQAGEQAAGGAPRVRVQVTPALLGSFPTVAVKARVALSGISPLPGKVETVTAGTVTDAVAVAGA